MLVLGVDPGVSGALALIDTAGPRFIACLDMPILRFGTLTRIAVDPRAVGDWVAETKFTHEAYPEAVVVEHQQPMPGDGKGNAFVLGITFGAVVSVLAGLGIPMHFTTPPQWKARADLIKREKERHLAKARQIFGVVDELEHGRGKGGTKVQAIARADAGLVAFFGLPERVIGKREWSRAELFMQANLP